MHNLIAEREFFKSGLDRLRKGISDHNLTLLCSERDPLDCHRAVLVCRHLPEFRSHITHIHTDGHIEPHTEFETRLMAHHNLTPLPLLDGALGFEPALREAYEKQSLSIAFTEMKTENPALVSAS
jgi:hypothetical protein